MPNKNKRTTRSKSKQTKKNSRQVLPAVLVVGGCILLAVSAAHYALKLRALLPNYQAELAFQTIQSEKDPGQRPVSLTYLDHTVTLETGEETATGWTLNTHSAFHVAQSAYPGEVGNVIIYGHNTRNIFGALKQLQPGDTIALSLANGQTEQYQIFDVVQVKPSETGYLLNTGRELLTVYTCAGLFDSERLLVRAVPVEIAS